MTTDRPARTSFQPPPRSPINPAVSNHFLPKTESELSSWALLLGAALVRSPAALGVSPDAAATFLAEAEAFAASLAAVSVPAMRTTGLTARKNEQRDRLVASARRLVPVVRSYTAGESELQVNLGLFLCRERRKRVPPPTLAPVLSVESGPGRSAVVRLRDATRPGRARPEGVVGAILFAQFTADVPRDNSAWAFVATTTATTLRVPLTGGDLYAPAPVWLTARWLGTALQSGPPSNLAHAYLLPTPQVDPLPRKAQSAEEVIKLAA